jgi:hypothetical protein
VKGTKSGSAYFDREKREKEFSPLPICWPKPEQYDLLEHPLIDRTELAPVPAWYTLDKKLG